jgi:hypothetical protein
MATAIAGVPDLYELRVLTCLGVAAFVAGCNGGSGEGLDSNGRPVGEGGGGGPLVATFESVQDNVFTPSCAVSGCHVGAAAPQGLQLDAANSYASLVNVASGEVGSLDRVEPGDPDNSYVIQKLEGRAAVGERMPLGGPYLPQETIDVIRQWIADGAPPDSGDPDAPPTVVSTTPAGGAVVGALPAEITISFSKDMDASLVNEASVLLTASGGDGAFGDDADVAITPAAVALDPGNARRAVVDLEGVDAAFDVYELRLAAGEPFAIADVSGIVLDGDGDGEPGGDFVATFTVAEVEPTLESIQAAVFGALCSSCHGGPASDVLEELPDAQDLSSAQASFDNLVGVASLEVPELLRVEPGDADASYLVQKLEGTAAVGDRMPLTGGPLPASTIAAIRAWIEAGATFEPVDDVTPPTVSIVQPSPVLSGVVTLVAEAADDVGVARVEFFANETPIGTADAEPFEIEWDTRELENGSYALTADASDAAGNVGQSRQTVVTLDNDVVAPEVVLTAPADGATLTGVVTLSADATDDRGVERVEFLVDGDAVATDDDGAPYAVDWDSATSDDGAHVIEARAVDAGGNATTSDPVDVTTANDFDPPTVAITSPADGAVVSGDVVVAVDADDENGVEAVEVLVDGVLVGSDDSPPYQVLWDTAVTGDGAHTLVARAVDGSGNEGESAPVAVTVDNACADDVVPPTVALTAPDPGLVSGLVAVAADAEDDVAVTQVLFFADGVLIDGDDTAPYQVDWDTAGLADGDVELTAQASDACGNETTSAPVVVTVDNTGLVVASVDPAEGADLLDFPTEVVVTFDGEVDPATVDAASFVLVRSNGDGVFDDGDDVAIAAPVDASGTTATMDLSAAALVKDTYRVTLTDAIEDLAGNALDGDGNGSPGGDFTAQFVVVFTYTEDAQPIYAEKCDTCHTIDGSGDHNIGTNYEDAFLLADDYDQCEDDGLTVGECTIVLIREGEMPLGAGCTGDPVQDAGNPDCLTQEQQDVIQGWIDAGMPE